MTDDIATLPDSMMLPVEETEPWFRNLVDDIENIRVEGEFNARWALIECRHQIGLRILAELQCNEKAQGIGLKDLVQRVARHLNRSDRTVYQSVQFASKFPDTSMLPEGKDISWHKICNKYLPEPKQETKEDMTVLCECGVRYTVKCPECGKVKTRTQHKKEG